MGSFTEDLKRFGAKTEKAISMVVRKIVLDVHRRVVMRSPVDVGRFRANNQISLNDLPSSSTLAFDKNGAATIRKGEVVMATFDLGDTVFIYNNVAYALPIEYGHSKRAPGGVYRISIQDILTHINKYAREAKQ